MRAEITALTVSAFINTAVFAGLDKAAYHYESAFDVQAKTAQRATLKKIGTDTQFDFVEVPPVVSLRKPLETNKVAAHDSVAQDPSRVLEAAREAGPKMEHQGEADQLEQHRAESLSSSGSPASTPSIATPPSPPAEQKYENAKTEAVPKNAQSTSEEAPDPSGMTLQAPSPPKPPTLASPALKLSPSVRGQAVRDRIDAPAVSRARSHGAQVYGMTSFDATGSGMGQYMKNLKERIWLAWFPYLSFHYPKDFRSADAVIQFTLDKEGQVRNVQVASLEGSPVFAAFCMEAVQRASPFGLVPTEVMDLTGRDELDVQFAFHFW